MSEVRRRREVARALACIESERERCDHCNAILARDNRDELCSPCGSRREQIKFEREVAAWKRRRNYSSDAIRELEPIDVPMPTASDSLQPEVIMRIVYFFAKTKGNQRQTAMRANVPAKSVAGCLRREAARGIVQSMIEDEIWPSSVKLPGDEYAPTPP